MKNPFQFIDEVRQETSKVTWPTWKEVWITTAMVLVMVTLTAVFFLFADMIIAPVIRFILQLGRETHLEWSHADAAGRVERREND